MSIIPSPFSFFFDFHLEQPFNLGTDKVLIPLTPFNYNPPFCPPNPLLIKNIVLET